jgi:hypothetical protein
MCLDIARTFRVDEAMHYALAAPCLRYGMAAWLLGHYFDVPSVSPGLLFT